MNTLREFWVVWCEGGGTPVVQHNSFDAAQTEANRLARLHQDRRFWVLHSIGCAESVTVQWHMVHADNCGCTTCVPF